MGVLALFATVEALLLSPVPRAPPCVRHGGAGVCMVASPPADTAAGREVLWEPKPEVVETTAMRKFQKSVGVDGGYDELWKWLSLIHI